MDFYWKCRVLTDVWKTVVFCCFFMGWSVSGGPGWSLWVVLATSLLVGRQLGVSGGAWGGHQPEATRQVGGNTSFQGGSKFTSYKHSGCKIEASRLQALKSEDLKDAPVN